MKKNVINAITQSSNLLFYTCHKIVLLLLTHSLPILVFDSLQPIYAQYTKYKQQAAPMWQVQQPTFAPIDTMFRQDDAVILSEKNEWTMNDIEYSTIFKKHIAIQFLTPQGLAKYNRINIPETTDPQREYADLPLSKREAMHRPKYFDLELLYITARLIKPDGTVRFITLQDSIETENLWFNAFEYRAYSYHFSCRQAEVGDILEVQYQYYLPFVFDYRRLFFHGNLPKQEYELQINYHPRQYYIWQAQNGAHYTDSVKTDKNTRLTWHYKNLPACIDEANAQPHRDLPHIQYYIHNKNFGEWDELKITKYMPYTWTYFTHDQVGFRSSVKYKHKTKLNRKEVALNQFYEKYGSDTLLPLPRWAKIQQDLNDNFNYQALADATMNIDPRMQQLTQFPLNQAPINRLILNRRQLNQSPLQKLLKEMTNGYMYNGIIDILIDDPTMQLNVESGRNMSAAQLENIPEALNKQLLKNTNVQSIYTGLLNRLDAPYYKVLLNDRRVASLNTDQFQPLWGENRLWAMHIKGNIFYITPKNRRFGYQLNELPFYLENIPSVHIAQLTDSYKNPDVMLFYSTPNSDIRDNMRTTDVKMNIKLAQKEAKCEAKVVLNGQYSTLIRENYLYGTQDSSINQQYYQRPDQLSTRTTAAQPIIEKKETQFPYKTQVRLVYNDNTLLAKPNDTIYTLSLKGLIQHVIDTKLTAQKRDLPYYADFKGIDIFRYQIIFDQPIKLQNAHELATIINNKFGTYHFKITQANPQTLSLQSEFITRTDRIAPEHIADVAQIFEAIKIIDKQKIRITTE